MGVIPNPNIAFIFPISCILALIFPILIKYFPKCVGRGIFPKSQIKSLQYAIYVRSLVKRVCTKICNFLIFQPKCMLWVLKRTVSLRWFF